MLGLGWWTVLGRIRRCDLVGEINKKDVTLLEEVCHCGLALMF